jgi:hypothetical protein
MFRAAQEVETMKIRNMLRLRLQLQPHDLSVIAQQLLNPAACHPGLAGFPSRHGMNAQSADLAAGEKRSTSTKTQASTATTTSIPRTRYAIPPCLLPVHVVQGTLSDPYSLGQTSAVGEAPLVPHTVRVMRSQPQEREPLPGRKHVTGSKSK